MDMTGTLNEFKEVKPINVMSFKDKIKTYKRKPLSFVLLILVTVSALITIGVLSALIIYIVVKGV